MPFNFSVSGVKLQNHFLNSNHFTFKNGFVDFIDFRVFVSDLSDNCQQFLLYLIGEQFSIFILRWIGRLLFRFRLLRHIMLLICLSSQLLALFYLLSFLIFLNSLRIFTSFWLLHFFVYLLENIILNCYCWFYNYIYNYND